MTHDEVLLQKTVLVVEDDPMALHSMSRLIRFRVREVYEAIHGQDGLDKYQQHNPDIVVTDLEMPVMSGMQMVKILKTQDSHRPVIVVTAFADEEHLVPEADYILVKPIIKSELINALQKMARK